MRFTSTVLPEVVLIQSEAFEDQRGTFFESYRKDLFSTAGIQVDFVQDNLSASIEGVLRGIHYQIHQPQGKLVWVIEGAVFDVVVDLRRHSSNFGHWVGVTLSSERKNQLWIPPGFAHGFYVIGEKAEMLYKVTDYHSPQWERTLVWNDPALGIDWPIVNGELAIFSDKEMKELPLSAAEVYD